MKIIKTKRASIFLSYYPLKQGLKQNDASSNYFWMPIFLSYYPLKQGLKQKLLTPVLPARENFYPTIH